MLLLVYDYNYVIPDDFFTTPFGHPSYVILDGDHTMRRKFISPCCGYSSYFDCTANIAKVLDTVLTKYINGILAESSKTDNPFVSLTSKIVNSDSAQPSNSRTDEPCQVRAFSEWSSCSVMCGSLITGSGRQ